MESFGNTVKAVGVASTLVMAIYKPLILFLRRPMPTQCSRAVLHRRQGVQSKAPLYSDNKLSCTFYSLP